MRPWCPPRSKPPLWLRRASGGRGDLGQRRRSHRRSDENHVADETQDGDGVAADAEHGDAHEAMLAWGQTGDKGNSVREACG